MIFIPETPRAPSFEFNRPIPQFVVGAEYSGKRAPTKQAFQDFIFDQMFIPLEGGNHRLRLRKPLTLRIDTDTMRFTVIDWGIEMEYFHLTKLPREVARRFLILLDRAERENLSEADQADWLRITDCVDFQQFTIERSAHRYMEGTLCSNASVVIVEWHDQSRETLDWNVGRALSEVNPGERFSAFVKLGKDNKAIAIERVSFLSESRQKEGWDTWPKKN